MSKSSKKHDHPPTSEMVTVALEELNDTKGSSYLAIKKYIGSTYDVDVEKFAPFIKRYLKSAVATGALLQPKGQGASGSFKLAVKEKRSQSSDRASRALKRNASEGGNKKISEKKKSTKVAGKKPKAKTTKSTKVKSPTKVK